MNWRGYLGPGRSRNGVYQNAEFEAGQEQAPPDVGSGATDNASQAQDAFAATPLGAPPAGYDVRSVYDSRPVNAYDFNISLPEGSFAVSATSLLMTAQVPAGYRMVPREWDISLINATYSVASPVVTASIWANGGFLPFNQGIVIDTVGTAAPIKTFFLLEENSIFGMSITVEPPATYQTGTVRVNVYGNLLPVTDVQLPFAIANKVLR